MAEGLSVWAAIPLYVIGYSIRLRGGNHRPQDGYPASPVH